MAKKRPETQQQPDAEGVAPAQPSANPPYRKIAEQIQSPGYGTMYANNVGVTITPWDFCLKFGQIQDTLEKVVLVEMFGVYMSPQHVKAFLGLLNKQIEQYEMRHGPIPEPVIIQPGPA
jgi:hypothetical protein